mmetsp:Transcript_14717/g.55472  ORF Transcript_14717/g.55472 Transcript_14717/m.55472 type:complete len:343 (-) Transcript_14717:707-1735(-)
MAASKSACKRETDSAMAAGNAAGIRLRCCQTGLAPSIAPAGDATDRASAKSERYASRGLDSASMLRRATASGSGGAASGTRPSRATAWHSFSESALWTRRTHLAKAGCISGAGSSRRALASPRRCASTPLTSNPTLAEAAERPCVSWCASPATLRNATLLLTCFVAASAVAATSGYIARVATSVSSQRTLTSAARAWSPGLKRRLRDPRHQNPKSSVSASTRLLAASSAASPAVAFCSASSLRAAAATRRDLASSVPKSNRAGVISDRPSIAQPAWRHASSAGIPEASCRPANSAAKTLAWAGDSCMVWPAESRSSLDWTARVWTEDDGSGTPSSRSVAGKA